VKVRSKWQTGRLRSTQIHFARGAAEATDYAQSSS
jgi:hypothetical protein